MPELEIIEQTIRSIRYVKQLYPLKMDGFIITGKVEILLPFSEEILSFNIEIYPHYPFKTHDSESIRFINKELRAYNHVMHDGSICFHTSHNTDYFEKLQIDFNSLYAWIEKYYIGDGEDVHYEHIIVEPGNIGNESYSYIFTDVNFNFQHGEYGTLQLSYLGHGNYHENIIHNFCVYSFTTADGSVIGSKWSDSFKLAYSNKCEGIYIYIEDAPIFDGKFIIDDWEKLRRYFHQDFIGHLSKTIIENNKKINPVIPIFIGYKTIKSEIHWQAALLNTNDIPFKEEYVESQSGILIPDKIFISKKVEWAITENASYDYFFGRGRFCESLTNSKILIIGIGAVGSILGKSLVKGGCKEIWIADFDIKRIENICRSEYSFAAGISDKVIEFKNIMISNSPHVQIELCEQGYIDNLVKVFFKSKKGKDLLKEQFSQFDYIFDCSTDNDLMYMLDTLEPDCEVVNLSISNHANELVCAFSPHIYNIVSNVFEIVISQLDDLYEPTGCWSPTFKASYTDINLLVQMALKLINNIFLGKIEKQNFIVKPVDNDEGLKVIKI